MCNCNYRHKTVPLHLGSNEGLITCNWIQQNNTWKYAHIFQLKQNVKTLHYYFSMVQWQLIGEG